MKPDFHGVRCETENRTSLFNAVLADIAQDYRRPHWDGQANEMRDESADGFSLGKCLFWIGFPGRNAFKPVPLRRRRRRGFCGSALFLADNNQGFVDKDSY
jgi:hypothetical protein